MAYYRLKLQNGKLDGTDWPSFAHAKAALDWYITNGLRPEIQVAEIVEITAKQQADDLAASIISMIGFRSAATLFGGAA